MPTDSTNISRLFFQTIAQLFQKASKTSLDLFKITIPISIVTRILNELGLTEYLGFLLSPVMEVVGLPGSMGLVWATTMVINMYAGMVVFVSLATEAHLTVAQVTVLTTMMLVAHSLPVELRIAQKSGPRLRVMLTLRIVGALAVGFILHKIYTWGGYLQTESIAIWSQTGDHLGWMAWAFREVRNLFSIFLIILALLTLMKALAFLKITDLLTFLLKPVLSLLGMSKAAAPITIIGMTMGLAYGGGLIIQEAQSGRMAKRDIFFSLAFMGLFHSAIEDTLLMVLLGGHTSGIIWGRLAFAFVTIFLMVQVFNRISEKTFNR
ncbi:hypothetical protein KKA14_19475, partial [bacterium]|nr:hypothetical protein [bacterium]